MIKANGDWLRAALWLIIVLVLGAYGYAWSISSTVAEALLRETTRPQSALSKDYIDAKFEDLQKQITQVRDDIRELKR